MSTKSKFKVLTQAEIKQLNRDGFDLNEEKFYGLAFLINDQQNHAADPRPFKVATSFVESLTKTGMGRPWLPDTLPNGKHIRPKPDATSDEILQFQKDFAGGIMRGYFVNPLTHTGNVIIEIFPEFVDAVQQEKIPMFVSPMVGNWKENNNGEITQGEILHLQSVDSPGYDKEFAKFLGTCTGNFNECALELEPLAAAGKLKAFRNSTISCPKKFLNTLAAQGTSMSDQTNAAPETSGTNGTSEGETKIIEKLDEIETKVETIEAGQETMKDAVMEVAVGATGVDENKIKEKLGMGAATENSGNPPKKEDDPPVAAAGQQDTKLLAELKQTRKELDEIKKERNAEKELAAQKERERQVGTIIKSKLLYKEIKVEDKEKITNEWMEKKSVSDPEKLADLSILAEEAQKRIDVIIPEENSNDPLGSYGNDDYTIPDSDGINYKSIEEDFS